MPQDYNEAAKWYQAAVVSGNKRALGPLGALYAKMGDNVSAHMWFNLAAAADDRSAAEYRDAVAKRMTPAQIVEAQKLARQWDTKQNR